MRNKIAAIAVLAAGLLLALPALADDCVTTDDFLAWMIAPPNPIADARVALKADGDVGRAVAQALSAPPPTVKAMQSLIVFAAASEPEMVGVVMEDANGCILTRDGKVATGIDHGTRGTLPAFGQISAPVMERILRGFHLSLASFSI